MEISTRTRDAGELTEFLSGETVVKQLANTEILIDVMETKLVAVRQLGLNEITLKEIRILEGKLIKHFSQQLNAKRKMDPREARDLNRYPSLSKLLNVAGVGAIPANSLLDQGRTVEDLMRLSDIQLQSIVTELSGSSEDGRKLISALSLLKKFLKNQEKDTTDLYWDSWSKDEDVFNPDNVGNHDFNENLSNHNKSYIDNCPLDHSTGTSRNNSESSGSLLSDAHAMSRTRSSTDPSSTEALALTGSEATGQRSRQIPSTSSSCLTPPSPSHGSRSSLDSDSGFIANYGAASPPPRISMSVTPSTASNTFSVLTPPVTPGTPHKTPHYIQSSSTGNPSLSAKGIPRGRVSSSGHGTSLGRQNKLNPNILMPPFNKLKPSKSSEWHIGNRILPSASPSENLFASNQSLSSISTTSSGPSKLFSSKTGKKKKRPHDLFFGDEVPNFINMSRTASRRSSTTLSPENNMLNSGSPLSPRTPMTPATPSCSADMWSKDRDVASHAGTPRTPKSKKTFKSIKKAIFTRIRKKPKLKRNQSTEHTLNDDNSLLPPHSSIPPRRRSDTLPSSKALLLTGKVDAPDTRSLCTPEISKAPAKPDFNPSISSDSTTISTPLDFVDTDKTLIVDPADDRVSTLVGEVDPIETVGDEDTLTEENDPLTKDNLFRQGSMMHSEEWDIPYSELDFFEKIGCGRVGTVHRGKWHGDVAIRVIDINHNEEDKLRAFKQEIMIYKKTRHENLELFMGSCMHPPHLAIVTGFCRGHSLYSFIRTSKTQFININQAKIIAQHIVQGMGYLHSKGIIHKDLKSKNIFVDGKKVVITDFGLVGLHAVSRDSTGANPGVLMIPDGWLCYLAPEVIKALRFPQSESDDVISTLPYTMKSDVFAFGTVWYELLSRTWPFNGFSAESIIWQVGSGKKQNLSQLQGGKDVKDIIMQSWAYNPDNRPDFSDNGIMGFLKKLQTQIHRSLSSHPRRGGVNRGASHERLFDGPPLRHAPFSTMHDLME